MCVYVCVCRGGGGVGVVGNFSAAKLSLTIIIVIALHKIYSIVYNFRIGLNDVR